MSKNLIILVSNDSGGREALYLNGDAVFQNNPMPRFEVTDLLKTHQPFEFQEAEVSSIWLDKVGRYPATFAEIPNNEFTVRPV